MKAARVGGCCSAGAKTKKRSRIKVKEDSSSEKMIGSTGTITGVSCDEVGLRDGVCRRTAFTAWTRTILDLFVG